MQTLIVPIDFSSTSLNAATYAANFSVEIDAQRLVLFHTTIGTDKSAASKEEILALAEQEANAVAQHLKTIAPHLELIIIVNNEYLLQGIEQLSSVYTDALVIMGITGKNFIEQKLIGSNTLAVVKTKGIPILVIPGSCAYAPIRNIGLAIQYKADETKQIPSNYIVALCQKLSAQLSIINIDKANASKSTEMLKKRQAGMEMLFSGMQIVFHYMKDSGVTHALYSFIYQMNIDLIIALTEENGFLKSIYKQGLAQTLPYVINKPILIMKP